MAASRGTSKTKITKELRRVDGCGKIEFDRFYEL